MPKRKEAQEKVVAKELPQLSRDELIATIGRLQGQLESLATSRRASNAAAVAKTFIRCSAGAIIACMLAHDLAGKTTKVWATLDAKVSSSSLEEILKSLAPPWWFLILLFIGLVVATGTTARYRRLWKQMAERLGEATQKYETAVDPNRSSSGLARTGQTHERDQT